MIARIKDDKEERISEQSLQSARPIFDHFWL